MHSGSGNVEIMHSGSGNVKGCFSGELYFSIIQSIIPLITQLPHFSCSDVFFKDIHQVIVLKTLYFTFTIYLIF